jgi:hypothetical protein
MLSDSSKLFLMHVKPSIGTRRRKHEKYRECREYNPSNNARHSLCVSSSPVVEKPRCKRSRAEGDEVSVASATTILSNTTQRRYSKNY